MPTIQLCAKKKSAWLGKKLKGWLKGTANSSTKSEVKMRVFIVLIVIALSLVFLYTMSYINDYKTVKNWRYVNKEFTAEHNSTITTYATCGKTMIPITIPLHHDDLWELIYEGISEKGKKYTKRVEVSREEYDKK